MTVAILVATKAAIGAMQAALQAAYREHHLSTVKILPLEQVQRYDGLQQLMASPPYP